MGICKIMFPGADANKGYYISENLDKDFFGELIIDQYILKGV